VRWAGSCGPPQFVVACDEKGRSNPALFISALAALLLRLERFVQPGVSRSFGASSAQSKMASGPKTRKAGLLRPLRDATMRKND
jgi:hypothetical protein